MYKIRDWDDNFENNKTRILKNLQWVPIPNKLDGDGYLTIMDLKDGPAIFGTWIAVVELASKCRIRGTLIRDNGTPHTPKTISRITRISESLISKMFEICSKDPIWIESDTVMPESGTTMPEVGQRREGKEGKEGNGMELQKKSSQIPEDFKVSGSIKAFCINNDIRNPESQIESFIDFHRSKGNVFKDKDAAFRTWLRNGKKWGSNSTLSPVEIAKRNLLK